MAAYTEPDEYRKRDSAITGEEEFELYERIIGRNTSLPGFSRHRNTSKQELMIAILGFDSQRLTALYDEIAPKCLIPVIGFPSFVPGWNLTALKMNHKIIKDADCDGNIEYCEASSPFSIIDLLKNLYEVYNDSYEILIAPLGTRPLCLGVAIFSTLHKKIYPIYDFPIEKKFRSKNILRANIYNLTSYLSG